MFRTAVIILVSNKTPAVKTEKGIREFLIPQLNILNFEVKKLLIKAEQELLSLEFNTLSKQYDILLIVGELNNNIILNALGNICCKEIKIKDVLTLKTESDLQGMLPPTAKLLTSDNLPFPVIYLQRIFILKEDILEEQFNHVLKKHLQQYALEPLFKKVIKVHLNGNSNKIVDTLKKLVHLELQSEDSVSNLIVSSPKFENLVECEKKLKHELNENFIESSESIDVLRSIYESTDQKIVSSLEVIEKCLDSYGPDNTFLSFNGGKDCTVLLHLVYTVLKVKYPDYKKPIICLYVKSKETFEEQDTFISQCSIFFNLNIIEITSDIKNALNNVITTQPNLKAVFMGTRRTDPYSQHLDMFQMTDPNWPQIMRVSPLLDWHFSDIWDYLLFYKVPYCKLYDLGYTSLGSSSNTVRNPSLAYFDTNQGKNVYLPAYKLINESEERSGRNIGK
ncbi:unnamed protein product [Psylliodes chrysocephalus]|uniref:FAD synthase n=1 Tax=Psylliodes chrysocephalus TaxID=3402493 RepID=A0A9P0CQZ9_9CUCU|nr:unnamed protein product [Psylliodes chrysocephala]